MKRFAKFCLPMLWMSVSAISAFADAPDCSVLGFPTQTTHGTLAHSGLNYTGQAGFVAIPNSDHTGYACLFYNSYTKDVNAGTPARPVTFLMNGGPGYASAWLQFGGLGPQRIGFGKDGTDLSAATALGENETTVLTFSDLVFVDPVGTGYSVLAPGTMRTQFEGVMKDAQAAGDFVQSYLTTNHLTASPLYMLGESYGGIRVPIVADYLNTQYKIALTGFVLLAPQLDAIGNSTDLSNDLPYITFLPTYALIGSYYKKLAPPYQALSNEELYQRVKHFADGVYAEALMKGESLKPEVKVKLEQELQDMTGLPIALWDKNNLRIKDEDYPALNFPAPTITSYYDARVSGNSANGDPFLNPANAVLNPIAGSYFPSVFHISKDLNYVGNYNVYANGPSEWALDNEGQDWDGSYRSSLPEMDEVLNALPKLSVYIGTGFYDEICPAGPVEYLINRLTTQSATSRVHVSHYPSGHMLYMGSDNATRLQSELQSFYRSSLNAQANAQASAPVVPALK